MARKAKPKSKVTDEVLADLETLKDTIEALDEVLNREDFDNEYDAGDAWELCEQIEELTIVIKKAVEAK